MSAIQLNHGWTQMNTDKNWPLPQIALPALPLNDVPREGIRLKIARLLDGFTENGVRLSHASSTVAPRAGMN